MSRRARVPGMTAGQAANTRISLSRIARYRRRRQESQRARDIHDAAAVLDQRRDHALQTVADEDPGSEEQAA